MNYDYQTYQTILSMQTQASSEEYRQYLAKQLEQCRCSLALQQQTAYIQNQTQRILSPSDYDYTAPLLSLNEIQRIIEPQKVTTEYCCEDRTKPKKTNCVNCGAALRGRHRCIYCDTYNE